MTGWDDSFETRDDERTRRAARLARNGDMVSIRNVLDELHHAQTKLNELRAILGAHQPTTSPQLGAVCRIVFLHGKENPNSVVYRQAAEELAKIGLVPT